MPYVKLGERRLYYTRQGKPRDARRPTLLLIHGAGGSHLDWPPDLRRIDGHKVIAVDLPGHGRSQPPGCSTVKAYAETILDLIRQLELGTFILGGHSMGGAIALQMALERPTRLVGLVLFASGARLRVRHDLLESLPDRFDTAVEEIIAAEWSENTPAQLVELSRRQLARVEPSVLKGDLLACDGFNLIPRLPEIDVPTLAITGTADLLTPFKYAEYVSSAMPRAKAIAIRGAGHQVMLERPKEVAEAVRAFLSDLAGE